MSRSPHLAVLSSVVLVAGCSPEAWGIRYSPVATTAPEWSASEAAAVVSPEGNLVVFVDGSGGHLTAGTQDDAPNRVSSTVSFGGLGYTDLPAFEGTAAEWQGMLTCAANHFSGLPISLVDQRPASNDYLLVMVGGTASHLAAADYWGLASTGSATVVERGVGFVFSAGHRVDDRARHLCETLAHEIGHILGLEHSSDCRDLMSTDRSCAHEGFLEGTRAILTTSLSKWRPTAAPPVAPPIAPPVAPPIAPPVEVSSPERLTGLHGESSAETGLYPELHALRPAQAGSPFAYWPVSLTASKSIARAVLYVVLPGPLVGVYYCSHDGSGCVVSDQRLDGSYPVSDPGTHHMLIEVVYADGEVRRTPWVAMTKP